MTDTCRLFSLPTSYHSVLICFATTRSPTSVQRGPSGSGKSVLLKCLAHLLVYPTGTIHLSGQSPADLGVPVWRSKVLYLPQRPALLPGTPNEFWETLKGFKSRKGREDLGDPWQIAAEWGIARPQWDQTWGSLSGGEGQRIALAVALALKPAVLLLDGELVLLLEQGEADSGARSRADASPRCLRTDVGTGLERGGAGRGHAHEDFVGGKANVRLGYT